MRNTESRISQWTRLLFLLAPLGAAVFMGCAAPQGGLPKNPPGASAAVENQWGIHMEGIRLTAQGHLVDFRYRVLDPNKAEALMRRGDEAYLIDQASGTRLSVPLTKVGQLRGTGTKPAAGRVYAVMFNSGGIISPGSPVTVVLGDFRAENLTVE